MGSERISAVSDAGPLIHLTEIDSLPLLRIPDTVHIPDAVWAETIERGRTPQREVFRLRNIQRHALSQLEIARFIEQNSLEGLQAGESECLYLPADICTNSANR
ncbi:MAG: hypothetical protein DRQ02_01720 [Candidatus Latescibacterota bacterium]|nr:MAG: hypothetical protein DRQ02_01720 [Candidatus Latescibacterota bacterium]